ncbi:uncharacterized protein LOC129393146 [Pan paniscus]|uniref:uncharacterized protein LOC129393146 n=1 Tax=Pan paniscus TaxID=9597 RepID=UPI002436D4C8|nr:uncharacterized protein LOC129393146 [Pan paniscus]
MGAGRLSRRSRPLPLPLPPPPPPPLLLEPLPLLEEPPGLQHVSERAGPAAPAPSTHPTPLPLPKPTPGASRQAPAANPGKGTPPSGLPPHLQLPAPPSRWQLSAS